MSVYATESRVETRVESCESRVSNLEARRGDSKRLQLWPPSHPSHLASFEFTAKYVAILCFARIWLRQAPLLERCMYVSFQRQPQSQSQSLSQPQSQSQSQSHSQFTVPVCWRFSRSLVFKTAPLLRNNCSTQYLCHLVKFLLTHIRLTARLPDCLPVLANNNNETSTMLSNGHLMRSILWSICSSSY